MKEKFIRFMYGRYGVDSFGKFTIMVAMLLFIISGFRFHGNSIFKLIAWALMLVSYYRMFSRQTYKRATENQKHLQKTTKIRNWFARQRSLLLQRKTYHIYTCPTCRQKIRIPKGKGKIEIRCPKCSATFIKRS